MNKLYRNYKKLSLWILVVTQILLISSYFFFKVDTVPFRREKISFIGALKEDQPRYTYHTGSSRIFLKSISSRRSFMDFNSSLCYTNGTDIVSMERSSINWECRCLPGWHGKDCGEPEVIWRAFLTYRKPLKITGPRTFQRRIIYIFEVNKFSLVSTEIRINELGYIIDLFILYEEGQTNFFLNKLKNNFIKPFHNKILYLNDYDIHSFLSYIRNVRDDDIILTSGENEIPNKIAINFLKFYNKWPEPLHFRLRWSVFGYFWIHPIKTIIMGGAASVGYFRETLNSKLEMLRTLQTNKGIILGDLNHYGGWFCEYCYDAQQILEFLSTNKKVNFTQIGRQKIDNAFIEDVIENGLYIDGKTELIRSRRYHETYFAPYYVMENDWKYDFLMLNLYSKIDYY